jgi:RNA polymerase sigma factor (sigma-70 family)
MRDDEVVASTVTGDPSELAEAYDRYAGVLYSYCRWLLREPADAAGVVRDTFVIASAKLAGLREPDRLRSWLFAVARSECLRKPRSRKVASPSGDAAERPDETADVIGEAELAGIHALIRAAVDGLNADEREVITQVCHGVEVPEVAAMLGVSRDRAYALFSRARDQLEASVGVLLTGRSGYRDCPALGTLLTGWDGRLTVRLRERAGRHIGKCPVCSDRRRRELRPATLLSLSPGALFGLAAAPGTATVPAGLRAQALRMATGTDPDAAAYRAALDSRHRSFGKDGFPRQPRSSHIGPLRTPHAQLAVAAGTATIAVTAVTVAVLLPTGGTHSFGSASLSPVTGRPGPPGPSEAPSATRPGASGRAGAAPTASSGSSGGRLPRPGAVCRPRSRCRLTE